MELWPAIVAVIVSVLVILVICLVVFGCVVLAMSAPLLPGLIFVGFGIWVGDVAGGIVLCAGLLIMIACCALYFK